MSIYTLGERHLANSPVFSPRDYAPKEHNGETDERFVYDRIHFLKARAAWRALLACPAVRRVANAEFGVDA